MDKLSTVAAETVLYGIRKGCEAWQEELLASSTIRPLTTGRIANIKAIAMRDGFDRFRLATVDLSVAPDFTAAVRRGAR